MATTQDSLTCPRCGKTTYNPTDIAEGYCAQCDDTTSGKSSLLAFAEALETGKIPEWRMRAIKTQAVREALKEALDHMRTGTPIGGV